MKFLSFRGAVTAAAMMIVSFVGAAPSAALAEAQPATIVRAATPLSAPTAPTMSGSAWISQGTVSVPSLAQAPVSAAVVAPIKIKAGSLMALVGDMPPESDMTPDLKCLAQAVYFESRGEPMEGQLAVAEVVINRAKSGRYPDNYCDVVAQPAQFSFVHHGVIPTADETSSAWQRAEAIAQIAQQNLWQSKAADALYFHATYVRPSWARQKVELAQIETHIFYR